MSSHGKLAHSRLTFVSDKDEVFSLESPYNRFLQEEHALSFLQEQYKNSKHQEGRDKVLCFPVRGMLHSGTPMKARVLHADETPPPLAFLQVNAAMMQQKAGRP